MSQRIEVVIAAKKLYAAALREADRDFKGFGSNVGTYIKAGSAIAAAALATMTYAAVKATAASREFNRSMAETATLIPGNAARINELKGNVQELSMELGTTTEDLAGGLYQVVSAFGDAADSAEKLRIVAVAGKAGLASTTDSLNLLSAVTKGYGDTSAAALQHVSDLAFTTVRLGQTTFPELAASMGRVIPVAAKLNVAQEEVFASFATLTGVTGQTSEVSTQYAAILRGLIKPTTGMKEAVEKLGYANAETMLEQMGLVESLKALIGTTDGTTASVGKLFESSEALPAIFALTGSQASVFAQKLREMKDAGGATNAALKEQTTGINEFDHVVNQAAATWSVFYQKLGDFITQNPAVLNAIRSATNALKEFARIIGLDVRSDVENLVHDIVQLERAQDAGAITLNDNTYAAREYAGKIAELMALLSAEQEQTEATTVAIKAEAEARREAERAARAEDAAAATTAQIKKAALEAEKALEGFGPSPAEGDNTDSPIARDRTEHEARLAALEDYHTRRFGLMAQAGATQAQLEAEYSRVVMEQAQARRAFMLDTATSTFGAMSNMMQNLTVLTGKEGGAAFEAMKAFAVAETAIQTYRAAQGAYAALAPIPVVGPALATAAAAAATVAGLARVKQITSMQPGGSASGSTISAGGTANPGYSGGSPSAYPPPTRTEEPQRPLNVTLVVNNPLDGRIPDELAENLFDLLERGGERGYTLNNRVIREGA